MNENRRPKAIKLVRRPDIDPQASTHRKKRRAPATPKRLTPSQRRIWSDLLRTVDVSPRDLFLVETVVCLIDQQRTLQAAINQDGPIAIQANGRPMHNPAATALRQLEAMLTRGFRELGMTPATRARLKLDKRTDPSRGRRSRWSEF